MRVRLGVAAFAVGLLAALGAATLPSPRAVAQSAGSPTLTLTPATSIVTAKFGQTTTQTFTLRNGTSSAFAFKMEVNDVIVKGGKRVFVRAGDTPGSIAASAIFSRRAGVVEPNGRAVVQVLLTIPNHTAVRAVAVYFRATGIVAAAGSVGLTGSLGGLVTFVLTHDFALAARSVRIEPASAGNDLTVAQTLLNVGSEPVIPRGVAAFIDADGRLAAKVAFNTARLLPHERVTLHAAYAGRLRAGRYRVLCTFAYADKTLTSEGVYTAP